MKKYKIDNYIVKANSPIEAMKAVQTLKDSKIKDATKSINEIAEYFRVWGYPSRSELQEIVDFYKLSKNDMKKIFGTHYDETDLIKLKYYDSIKDAAFDRSTIDALIADEQAAIDAYNVAIANLKGKLSDEAIKVLQVIRDDEQNHVANFNAILSNNITEKNLEDSIKDKMDKSSAINKMKSYISKLNSLVNGDWNKNDLYDVVLDMRDLCEEAIYREGAFYDSVKKE